MVQEINSRDGIACCAICTAGIYLEYIIKFMLRMVYSNNIAMIYIYV